MSKFIIKDEQGNQVNVVEAKSADDIAFLSENYVVEEYQIDTSAYLNINDIVDYLTEEETGNLIGGGNLPGDSSEIIDNIQNNQFSKGHIGRVMEELYNSGSISANSMSYFMKDCYDVDFN